MATTRTALNINKPIGFPARHRRGASSVVVRRFAAEAVSQCGIRTLRLLCLRNVNFPPR